MTFIDVSVWLQYVWLAPLAERCMRAGRGTQQYSVFTTFREEGGGGRREGDGEADGGDVFETCSLDVFGKAWKVIVVHGGPLSGRED